MKLSDKQAIKVYLARIGAKGGKATGKTKARSSEQARTAAMIRWHNGKALQ